MATAKTVVVGCKLPTGVIIEHPIDPLQKVTLNGANKATIIGSGYGTTEVNGEFWEVWAGCNKEFAPFKNGAIFVAKTIGDVAAVAKELADESTGLEPMQTDGKDPRAGNVKTTTEDAE